MTWLGMASWRRGSLVLALGALLVACGGGSGSNASNGAGKGGSSAGRGGSSARAGSGGSGGMRPGTTKPPSDPDELEQAALEQLAECSSDADGGFSGGDADILASVVITDEFADSLHELIGCGQLSFVLCSAVIDGVIDAIIAQSGDATPDGWQFMGKGVYRTGNEGTTMNATFYLSEDFSFAKAGDPVLHDVFLVDSYLVDARLRVDFSTGKTRIEYDAPGPLVELLGFGAKPANPLPVDLDDLTSIKRKLRQLQFEGKVVVQDAREHSNIDYTLNVPRMSADKFITGALTMRYELEDAEGARADLGQKLVTDRFEVAYANHGTLEGTVELHVDGGPLEYAGTLVWADTAYPERTLMCR